MANGGWMSRADLKQPLKTAFRTQIGGLQTQVRAGTLPRAEAMTQAEALRERLRAQLRQQVSQPRLRPLAPIHTLPVNWPARAR